MHAPSMVQAVSTKEEADALIAERVADMMTWTCWCVSPNRAEVDRIVRGEFVYMVSWAKDPEKTARAERLFGYELAKELRND